MSLIIRRTFEWSSKASILISDNDSFQISAEKEKMLMTKQVQLFVVICRILIRYRKKQIHVVQILNSFRVESVLEKKNFVNTMWTIVKIDFFCRCVARRQTQLEIFIRSRQNWMLFFLENKTNTIGNHRFDDGNDCLDCFYFCR